jgi:hypothetical protein
LPLAHQTKVFAIKEARISRLLTDSLGAPPATYGATVALPGSKKLSWTEKFTTKYLKGDNRPLDSDAVPDQADGTFDAAKLSFDALAVLFSTAAVDAGSTPNQTVTWARLSTDNPQYFKLEARCASADYPAGDVYVTLWKCKLTASPTFGFMEEDYQLFNFPITILPTLADNSWYRIVGRETAVALA